MFKNNLKIQKKIINKNYYFQKTKLRMHKMNIKVIQNRSKKLNKKALIKKKIMSSTKINFLKPKKNLKIKLL